MSSSALGTRPKLFILGGRSGLGLLLAKQAEADYDVTVYGRPDIDLLDKASVERFGQSLSVEPPTALIINAYARTRADERRAMAQLSAVQVLWPFVKPIDMAWVIIGSSATWSAGGASDVELYRSSKAAINAWTLKHCWRKRSDLAHRARTIILEPATCENRPELAELRDTSLLTAHDAWRLISFALSTGLPYMRLGGQGA